MPLKVGINEYMEKINAAVTDSNSIDMFLEYNWLVKHNPEVNWDNGTIWFTRCLKEYRTKHQDILFISRTRILQPTEDTDEKHQEIGKETDSTNLEDLSEYIWPFTHLFNKKKFKKLPEQRKWDHKICLMENAPRELNTKVYTMTIKEDRVQNQWLEEQLKAELIVESSSRYTVLCFYIPKKDRYLQLV